MQEKKKTHPKIKSGLHPRNKNRERYNFDELVKANPGLKPFVGKNKYNDESIDFADADAVKVLNQAILKFHYQVEYWDIPAGYLCPPIPGRADYIHHIADLMRESNYGKIPKGKGINVFDVGVGANCIYPILGHIEYGWSFIGTDIDLKALESAAKIVKKNPSLKGSVEFRLQERSKEILFGVMRKDEFTDLTICNPPFHASAEEAAAATLRKLNNLNEEKVTEVELNFGGQSNELWYEGGEYRFLHRLVRQSKYFGQSCYWFSSLVSKKSNENTAWKTLKKIGATEIKTIPMGQGNKTSRIVVWTFLTPEEQKKWKNERWQKDE
jgi:23S rRNA (adenine1618-N6)-methyltransferase